MPLFRFVNPPVGLEDATYDYPANPDKARYEPADAPRKTTTPKAEPAKVEAPAAEEA